MYLVCMYLSISIMQCVQLHTIYAEYKWLPSHPHVSYSVYNVGFETNILELCNFIPEPNVFTATASSEHFPQWI